MNKKRFSIAAVFSVCIAICVLLLAGDASQKPVTISPGFENEVAQIDRACPTFSWSGLGQAVAYRLAVFESDGARVAAYEQLVSQVLPVLQKHIPGPALSWTPTSKEALKNGGVYVWYVAAVDEAGAEIWSDGMMFMIETASGNGEITNALSAGQTTRGVAAGMQTEVAGNSFEERQNELSESGIEKSAIKTALLVKNGGFDYWSSKTSPDYWQYSSNNAAVEQGYHFTAPYHVKCLTITPTSTTVNASIHTSTSFQNFSNAQYTVCFSAKSESVANDTMVAEVMIKRKNSTVIRHAQTFNITNAWRTYSYTFTDYSDNWWYLELRCIKHKTSLDTVAIY